MIGAPRTPVLPTGGFGIGAEQLTAMTRNHDFSALQEYGGASIMSVNSYKLNHLSLAILMCCLFCLCQVKGVANMLKTNLDKGIPGDEDDIVRRKNTFGANTYPQKKGRSFWVWLFPSLLFYATCSYRFLTRTNSLFCSILL